MTDNTEPTIDGEVRNIIGQIPNYVLGYLEISDGIKQEWADHQRAYLQIYSDRITKLISDQVREARISELEHLFDRADGERSARRYTAILEQRIKVLRTRLNGVKNK